MISQPHTPALGKKIPVSSWRVVIILSSVATMVLCAETMLVPAIPDLIKDFNITYSISSWILTTYLITGAVMTPIAVIFLFDRKVDDITAGLQPYHNRYLKTQVSQIMF